MICSGKLDSGRNCFYIGKCNKQNKMESYGYVHPDII